MLLILIINSSRDIALSKSIYLQLYDTEKFVPHIWYWSQAFRPRPPNIKFKHQKQNWYSLFTSSFQITLTSFFPKINIKFQYFEEFQARNCWEYILWWYLLNTPSFIEKYWHLAKLWVKIALKISIITYMGILFLAIFRPFFVLSGWKF